MGRALGQGEDLGLELGRFGGCGLRPSGEAAQHAGRGELVGSTQAGATHAAAALDQPLQGQPAQLLT